MAIFSNSEVTGKGHALLSKVLAGVCELKFTIAQAGDGHFNGDVLDLTELVNHRLDGRIVHVREMGKFTELDCIITNQHLAAFMEFREIGIGANDPDEGNILFAYANAGSNASPMGPFNGVWLHEEQFTIRVYTANATNIQAEITPSAFATEVVYNNAVSGLSAINAQDAIDELAAMSGQPGGSIKDLIIAHDQDLNAHALTINDREPIPQDGSAGTGTLVQLLGRLAHAIRLLNGRQHWWLPPNGSNDGDDDCCDGDDGGSDGGEEVTHGQWSISASGMLSNTEPFATVAPNQIAGTLVFKDGFVNLSGQTLDLLQKG